jgi:hypothetical protein
VKVTVNGFKLPERDTTKLPALPPSSDAAVSAVKTLITLPPASN